MRVCVLRANDSSEQKGRSKTATTSALTRILPTLLRALPWLIRGAAKTVRHAPALRRTRWQRLIGTLPLVVHAYTREMCVAAYVWRLREKSLNA